MKERPILFSAPMIRALLAGTKTQTRRVLKQAIGPSLSVGIEDEPGVAELSWLWGDGPGHDVHETVKKVRCPYGVPGDRLWVREGFSGPHHQDGFPPSLWHPMDDIWYWADGNPAIGDWTRPRPSIHMPRWASRLTLEVTEVRVERLQDISEADSRAEGITDGGCTSCGEPEPCGCPAAAPSARDAYCHLWGQINGPDSWAANPWVWAVSFRVIPPSSGTSHLPPGGGSR